MQLLFDIVIPVFILMVLGWGCSRTGLLEASSESALNRYVYYIGVPALMFTSTVTVDIQSVLQWDFIAVYLGGGVIASAVAFLAWRKMQLSEPLDWTVVALNSAWANTVYMGVPIFYFLFGDRGALPVIIATLASNILFILVLALMSELQSSQGGILAKLKTLLLQAVLKNPVMMAPLLGMLVSVSGISLPAMILTPIQMLAPSAAPVALFALGMSLSGLSVRGGSFELVWLTLVKLVLHPLATFGLALWVGLEPFWVASAVVLAALPTGAMVYVLAQQYNTRVTLTSATIMVTTLVSVVTLAILLPLMKQLGS
ncbi:AEC family transporter [Amphritea sp. 2_MG-2023]|uniref:AEC family transporter n=1 Tax=Amphritea TaxID=515417 RepID=UPI001C0704BE|nr:MULTISPECIES: AEC family transporter [Amphritea]MBU2965852.1 AEC family transporter [Amphritea atlantica]MDO6420763.1 AEC family transporter [Amphritea sp. 2_MG-2023]